MMRSDTEMHHIAQALHERADERTNRIIDLHKNLDLEIQKLEVQAIANNTVYAIKKKSYKKYVIFYEGKKLTRMGLMDSAIFITRRIVFVASALFLHQGNNVLAAIAIFMLSGFLKLFTLYQ